MSSGEYVLLDTRAFDRAIAKREELMNAYNDMNSKYDSIVNELLLNWQGKGADAFRKDALTVKTNIVGIFDSLKILCDTLEDCRAVFAECDSALGEYNRNPNSGGSSGS